jgi:hypothetical protein
LYANFACVLDPSAIRRTSTASGSLETLNDHHKDQYPHFHHVMSRHRPHAIPHTPYSTTGKPDKECYRQQRKGKIIKDGIGSVLPTILDDEDTSGRHSARSSKAASSERGRSPTALKIMPDLSIQSPKESFRESSAPESEQDNDDYTKVKFVLGMHSDDEELELEKQLIRDYPVKKISGHKKSRRSHSRSSHFTQDELNMRLSKGSELTSVDVSLRTPTDQDEAQFLENKDLEAMSHHRFVQR